MRRPKRGSAGRERAGRRPTADDFTKRAVGRAVLTETLQHPLTILPAAAAAVGGLYMGLLGAGPLAFGLTLGSAVVGAGSWIVNYFLRGEAFAERHVSALRDARRDHRHATLATLEASWATTGNIEGVGQARELREAFARLVGYVEETEGARGGIDLDRLRVLAEDTYDEGVRILRMALETQQALQALDVEKLRRELAIWQTELTSARDLGIDDPRLAGHELRIDGHRKRLRLYDERLETLAGLLAQSEVLESALESAYLEVVDLRSADTLVARGHAAEALERAVDAARRVEDRMRERMTRNPEADRAYLDAAESG